MKFEQEDLNKILQLRSYLIETHARCRDYKNNKNAIMRESDHVESLEQTIKEIDDFLKKYVTFS